MELTIDNAKGMQVLSFVGELDALEVQQRRSELEEAIKHQAMLHVVDGSEMSLIDSSGIGLLVYLYKAAVAANTKFALAGLNGQPADMIRFLKIDKRIPVYDSVGEARDAQL